MSREPGFAVALALADGSRNEYDGELCAIDELCVALMYRGRAIGKALFGAILEDRSLWPTRPATRMFIEGGARAAVSPPGRLVVELSRE